ncbi:MAG: S26 family signal peptidase [Acidimicrobiales bacterium]
MSEVIASPYPWAAPRRSSLCGALGLASAIGIGALLVRWLRDKRPLFRVAVEGASMLPELVPGDRLLAIALPVLERGDLVAIKDPEEPGRILVKRVTRLHAKTIEVRGDNAAVSRDSRQFGPVSRREVLGRVVYRYHPGGSTGFLPRPQPARRQCPQNLPAESSGGASSAPHRG